MLRGQWPFKALLARGCAVSLGLVGQATCARHGPCRPLTCVIWPLCVPGTPHAPWSVPACDMCHMAALCTWHVALRAVH